MNRLLSRRGAFLSTVALYYLIMTRLQTRSTADALVSSSLSSKQQEQFFQCWKQHEQPFFFRLHDHSTVVSVTPTWNEIQHLASRQQDATTTSRLITHVPHQLDSFRLEMGPFSLQQIDSCLNNTDDEKTDSSQSSCATLVVNDVDRVHDPLADWLDQTFAFLPRWRRDDAQISLAHTDGGIGPHVDSYNVFLIQMTGRREWKVGRQRLNNDLEEQWRIPDLDLSVLNVPHEFLWDKFVCEPGDVLYLPPRFAHWGTALSDNCMTLSVGCRAPSGAELLVRVAEEAITRHQSREYYAELAAQERGLFENDKASISLSTRERMRQFVRSAMEDILNDDLVFDELVGSVVTEPKRYLASRSFSSRTQCDQEKTLRCAPGVTIATSRICDVCRIFVNGEMWEIPDDEACRKHLFAIERGLPLPPLSSLPRDVKNVVEDLISCEYMEWR